MVVIKHRVNKSSELRSVDTSFGIEMDIRTEGSRLVVCHDPYQNSPETFTQWLESFQHRFLIVNLKECGIWKEAWGVLTSHGIEKFGFLDVGTPEIVQMVHVDCNKFFIRVSEWEAIPENLIKKLTKPPMFWLDCFSEQPKIDSMSISYLKNFLDRTCIVSPELQGRHDDGVIEDYRFYLRELEIWEPGMVCTKYPSRWNERY